MILTLLLLLLFLIPSLLLIILFDWVMKRKIKQRIDEIDRDLDIRYKKLMEELERNK